LAEWRRLPDSLWLEIRQNDAGRVGWEAEPLIIRINTNKEFLFEKIVRIRGLKIICFSFLCTGIYGINFAGEAGE